MRPYTKDDYKKLCEWWAGWKWPQVSEALLSDIGLIDEAAAGFLFTTNSSIAWLEWVVADKDAIKEQRNKSINAVIDGLCEIAKGRGYSVVWTTTTKEVFAQRLQKLGFRVGDRNSIQLLKVLGG